MLSLYGGKKNLRKISRKSRRKSKKKSSRKSRKSSRKLKNVVMIIIWNKKVLSHVRSSKISYPGKFACPGGSIDKGENPLNSAVRELYEETGLKINKTKVKLLYKKNSTAFYYLVLNSKPKIPGPLKKFSFEISKKKRNIGLYAGGYHYFLDKNDIKILKNKFWRVNLKAIKLLIKKNIL